MSPSFSAESSRPNLSRKIASYALTAGASFVAVDDVEAGVIGWTPDGNQPVVVGGNDELRVDLNRDGFDDYIVDGLIYNSLGALFMTTGTITNNIQNLVFGSAHVYASFIPIGGVVGPVDREHWHPAHKLVYGLEVPAVGEFLDKRGWAGLYFEIPGGSPHYGFLDVEGRANEIVIYGGGYESSADTPIDAVPEPTSLALFAVGFAGVLAWRLRRRPTKDVPASV